MSTKIKVGRLAPYDGMVVHQVDVGTKIWRNKDYHEVTETQAVHKGSNLYVTPTMFSRIKERTK